MFDIFKFSMDKPTRNVGTFIPLVARGDDSVISSGYPIHKPAVVIVQGTLQSKIHYSYLVTLLNLEGYDAYYPNLPSNYRKKPTTKMYDDAAVIKRVLEKLIQRDGREVILLMHCYGGVVGTQAVVQNLTKKWREIYGLAGGVVHLVYVSAFMLPIGESVATAIAQEKVCGEDGKWENMFIMLPDGSLILKDAPNRLYNDMMHESKKPEWWASFAQSMYHTHLLDPLSNAQYYAVRSTYICCENDRFIPHDGQLMMIEEMLDRGLELEMETCNGGHVPFLHAPQAIVEVINNVDLTPDYGRSLSLSINDENRQEKEGGMF